MLAVTIAPSLPLQRSAYLDNSQNQRPAVITASADDGAGKLPGPIGQQIGIARHHLVSGIGRPHRMQANPGITATTMPLRLAEQSIKGALLPLGHHGKICLQTADKTRAMLRGIRCHHQVNAVLC